MLAPFDMRLELAERRLFPGDYIDATLIVDSGKTSKATITVWLEARIHGKGNNHHERFEQIPVHVGEVTQGHHRYPVSFPVPNGPFTYHGRIVNISWYLCARADVPWAIDPKAEVDFRLDYRPNALPLTHVPASSDFADTFELTGSSSLHPFAGGLMLFALFSIGFLLLSMSAGGVQDSFGIFITMLFVGAFAFFFGFGALRRRAAEQKLGPLSIELDPPSPGPGESVVARIKLQPPRAVSLNAVHFYVTGIERVVRGSGTNRTTYMEVIFSRPMPLSMNDTIAANEARTFEARFDIPKDAPLSFDYPDNDLEWSIKVHLDIPRWPDWIREMTFNVVPNARLTADETESPVATADATADAPAEGLW